MLHCSLTVCGALTTLGVFLYALASERSAFIPIDENVKYAGLACILMGTWLAIIGLWRGHQA